MYRCVYFIVFKIYLNVFPCFDFNVDLRFRDFRVKFKYYFFLDYELSLHAYTKRPTSPINTRNDANRSLHKAYTKPTPYNNSKFINSSAVPSGAGGTKFKYIRLQLYRPLSSPLEAAIFFYLLISPILANFEFTNFEFCSAH